MYNWSSRHLAKIHAGAGGLSLLIVATFWLATVVALATASPHHMALTKHWIVRGLCLLIPALALTGASGRRLASNQGSRRIQRKLTRTRVASMVGLGVLVPCALYLDQASPTTDSYLVVQAAELGAGLLNATLLALNARDGRILTRRRRLNAREDRGRSGLALAYRPGSSPTPEPRRS